MRKVQVVFTDTFNNELVEVHEGYMEVNNGGSLYINKAFGETLSAVAIYKNNVWRKAEYLAD